VAFRKVSSFIYDQKRVSTQLQWEALFFFLYVWRRARELAHSTELIEYLSAPLAPEGPTSRSRASLPNRVCSTKLYLFFFMCGAGRGGELAHSTELIENLRVSGKRAESDVLPGPKHLPAERPPHVPSPSAFFSHHAYLCNLPQ